MAALLAVTSPARATPVTGITPTYDNSVNADQRKVIDAVIMWWEMAILDADLTIDFSFTSLPGNTLGGTLPLSSSLGADANAGVAGDISSAAQQQPRSSSTQTLISM